MSHKLEWAGVARGKIVEFGVQESDSGAVGISIVAAISEYFDPESQRWVNCESEQYESEGTCWIVKKSGEPNQGQVESLCKFAGWNGDLLIVADGTWQPTPCSFLINKETYKDLDRHRISFLNDWNHTPGAVGNVTPEKAKALQDRFGAQFRALAGNVARNTAPPAGKPPVPRGTGAKVEKDDGIPF